MNLTGKKVAVLGAGRSGRAAADLALHHGGDVVVYDAGPEEVFDGLRNVVRCHPLATEETGKACAADVVVISPGIETGGEFASSFAKGAGEFIGETEFASRYFDGLVIGITGTNGKTTTTELVQRMIEVGGKSCEACGNYGRPLSDVVIEANPPEAVSLELSSFQLETIRAFRPDVAVWLNFSPDHMDRYRSVDQYREAKLRIFENQREDDTAVVRFGEEVGKISASRISFSATESDADYALHGSEILYQGATVLDLGETRLRGLHNAENVMAALAAVEAVNIMPKAALAGLEEYAPPLHRCELVRTLDGVEYINDSKATNLHALEAAIRSQSRPTVLIAGGKEKGLDYTPLLPTLEGRVSQIVVFGEIRSILIDTFSPAVRTVNAESLQEAVQCAREASEPGGTVLFSPGTSSFDMFSGYEERGDTYRNIVHALK